MSDDNIFRIPESNMGRFKADILRLVKRANKIGVPAPEWTYARDGSTDVKDRATGLVRRVYEIIVTGESPKFDGWCFVASIDLDRENPGSPNVVNVLPGFEKDPEWTTMTERCDHCNITNKGRKKLVVVQHDSGERKIVGSTCLHDFLGHTSPKAIAAWAEILTSFLDTEDDYSNDTEPNIGRGEFRLDPVTYLSWVVMSIAERGWLPKSTTPEGENPTAEEALARFMAFVAGDHFRPMPLPSHIAKAEKVLEWGQEIELGKNDYMDNLAAIAQKSGWRARDIGYGASMVVAYDRTIDNKPTPRPSDSELRSALENTAAAPVHVVAVGDRPTLHDLTVVSIDEKNSSFGSGKINLVKLTDINGHRFVLWESGIVPAVGDVVCGRATIKKFGEFAGISETTIANFNWVKLPEDS